MNFFNLWGGSPSNLSLTGVLKGFAGSLRGFCGALPRDFTRFLPVVALCLTCPPARPSSPLIDLTGGTRGKVWPVPSPLDGQTGACLFIKKKTFSCFLNVDKV